MEDKIEINYKRATFGRRCLANAVDFILFVFTLILLFMSTRAIVACTEGFQNKSSQLENLQLQSGLYVEKEGQNIDVVTYNKAFDFPGSTQVYNAKIAVRQFDEFLKANADSEKTYNDFVNDMTKAALSVEFKGEKLYVLDATTNEIVRTDAIISTDSRFEVFFVPLIDDVCRSYLVTGIPHYFDLTKYMSNILFYVELPISYLTSGILVYFVPTLFFRKGRKTLGKAFYHIGLVDSRLLNPKIGRSIARFSIFYFVELILSLFTFGIPLIVSFSLMAFSKNKQGFPDYMLGLIEVDTSNNRIFNDYDEITLDELKHSKTPVNFKMERFD